MANSYKALKEQFVSNLSGGTIFEINLVTGVAPAAYLLWSALQAQHSFFQKRDAASSFVDFFLHVGFLLLAITTYASMPSLLLSLLLAPATLLLALPPSKVPPTRTSAPKKENGTKDMTPFPRRPFLTVYRGGMMTITCLAILAVDFRIFPRRFAKVETWGTSLMDVGVGSFVFAAGLVASKDHIRNRLRWEKKASVPQTPDKTKLDTSEYGFKRQSFLARLALSLRQSIPLLILGIIRLISVKNLEYAEHTTEYGVHWNFFFTLGLLPISLASLSPIFFQPALLQLPIHGILGILISIDYEFILNLTPLKAWALTTPRNDLISSNKEGLVSYIGYLSIFLLGMETGSLVLPRYNHPGGILFRTLGILGIHPERASHRIVLLSSLAICTAFYSTFLALFLYAPALKLSASFSIPISRRLANLPYVLWIAAFNTGQILLFALVESFVFPSVYRANSDTAEKAAADVATPAVLEDFNGGGLLLFVLANLGTGLVNMGIDTLKASNVQALAILVVYMVTLAVAARWLKGVKLKI